MKSENVIQYPISPWHGDSFGRFELPSPDGQVVAIFTQLIEIAMGAPVGSPLTIGGREIEGHFHLPLYGVRSLNILLFQNGFQAGRIIGRKILRFIA